MDRPGGRVSEALIPGDEELQFLMIRQDKQSLNSA